MGRLLGIARKAESRAPMEQLAQTEVHVKTGIEGDCRGTAEKRQVTVLSRESWDDACKDLEVDLPWTTRRANLFVEGVQLIGRIGQQVRIGGVVLEITDETRPCSRMDEAHDGLRQALVPAWRGGVTCRVVSGGPLTVGDPVTLIGPA